ncbi:hypothetical protein BGX34_009049 [Mortierella sp. NVP85]|nr:hypothetical protein BGX34_009049 [Mortierella sp. NVP85]
MSSKHHHPRIPIRSPERDGHDLMMTSVIDTNSSAYLNMDYYNIYRQQPLLLRPEGGRYDDKRAHGNHIGEENNQLGLIKPKSKPKARIGGPTDKGVPGSGNAKPQRKHSISLQATGTHRVLRHEAAHIKGERDSSQDVVSSLGIQDLRRSMSEGPSSSRASSRMSISHLLTSDDDSSSTHGTGSFERDAGSKRKMYHSNEIGEETPKRTRMSRKRAAELGLLDEDGNLILGRKRAKKVHDPDHVSPAGFRHGGERTVQEPEEPITLDSDIGPISILDRIPQPTVIWKGHPMSVVGKPGYELLHPHEVHIASTLRLSPAQYLSCKKILIMASREYHAKRDGKPFRKSDAQKLCRIDVNKTSRLWEVFAKIGWLEGISEMDI